MRSVSHIAAALVAALAMVTATPAAAAGAPASSAIVQDIDMSQFPRVTLNVIVPGDLRADGSLPVFEVRENGLDAQVVRASVKPVEQALDAVLLVDASGSMKGAPMSAARSAATAFIAELRPPSRAAVVAFSDSVHTLVPFSDDATALAGAVQRLEPGGETALYDGLYAAAQQVRARAGGSQPVIIVLSDGGDTVSRMALSSALSELSAAHCPVLVVALKSKESDPATLRVIAQRTGGRVVSIGQLDRLTEYYADLAKELQTSYVVSYQSNRPSTADLDIDLTARASSGVATATVVARNPLAAYEGVRKSALEPIPPASLVSLVLAFVLTFSAFAMFAGAGTLMLIRPRTGLDQMAFYDQANVDTLDAQAEPDRVIAGMMNAVDYVAGKRGFKRLAYEQLERAGLPLRPIEYIAAHFAFVVIVGALSEMLTRNTFFAIVIVILATAVPLAWLQYRISSRRRAFEEQLPDVLDLVAGSLRAGWGLQQALEVVVEQTPPPVCDEFRRALTETRLGRSVEQSLESIGHRVQSPDFDWAVSAISIQREVGGNLAELLGIVAATIRDRGALKRQISALTSEGRLSAGILLVLPFFEAIVLSFMNPRYMSLLYTTIPGLVMLLMGCALLVVGAIWLRNAVRVEV